MSGKKQQEDKIKQPLEIPGTLEKLGFFRRLNFKFSKEQKVFRDAIYNFDNKIVFCNAKAGTGKTTVAVATACAMVELGLYDGIVYIFAPVGYENVGLLPGTIEDKTSVFLDPLCQALIECGYQPEKHIRQLNKDLSTAPDIFIDALPHTFMRGINFENKIVIIEEAQNFYTDELKKVLTRIKDSCKTIVIGHDQQCDLYKHPENSGFIPYIQWFANQSYCEICVLTENFRGQVSRHADDLKIHRRSLEEERLLDLFKNC